MVIDHSKLHNYFKIAQSIALIIFNHICLFMKPQKKTTIYDIAKKLNLNASSVSRALSNDKSVSESTRQLILKTAEELNYKPNNLAANLRKGHNQTIGVVVPRIHQNFFSNIIAGIEAVTYEKGFNLVICQSNESFAREVDCINSLVRQQVSCIMISVSADFQEGAHLKNAMGQGIPLIQFDRVDEMLDTFKVINDNERASFEVVSHLIAQGYQRIALLEGPQNLEIFRQRKRGYLKAMEHHQRAVLPELVKENAWTKELGAVATKELLNLSERPDAIFASTSDFSALGVLDVASQMGLDVPSELGICGYSNEDFTEITSPSITTVDQHSVKMGETIAKLYFEEILSGKADVQPRTISVRPELIIRNSTLRN